MTENVRRRLSDRQPRPRTVLSRRSAERLLAQAKRSPRALALYSLAMRLGLGARACAGLDIADVSPDGTHAGPTVSVRPWDRRRRKPAGAAAARQVQMVAEVASAVERYLAWRKKACAHFRLPMQTYRDGTGAERCGTCHEVVPFLKGPLFLGRRGRRVGVPWLRKEFSGVRRRLRIPPGVRFAGLARFAATFKDEVSSAANRSRVDELATDGRDGNRSNKPPNKGETQS